MPEFVSPPEATDAAISAYRDALLRNAPRPELTRLAAPLDPEVVAWLELMRGGQRATAPDPDFVARLAAQLETAPGPVITPQPAPPAARRVRRSHAIAMARPMTPMESSPSRPNPLRRLVPHLATAALLVLALLGGLVASGSWPQTWWTVHPTRQPAVLLAPASPAAQATKAMTLLDVTIPPELLPQGDRISSIFEYATSPAGSTGRWLPDNSAGQPGLRVQQVLDGRIIVRAEDASQIVRAGSTTLENVAADAEITLEPGDTWITRNETVFEATNPQDAPTRVLIWVLANVEDPDAVLNYPVPSTWIEETYVLDQPAPGSPGIELPTGSARLRIQQLELEPKASYPAPEQGLQYGIASPFTANGSPVVGPSVTAQPNGKVVNLGRKAATAFVLDLTAAAEAVGTP